MRSPGAAVLIHGEKIAEIGPEEALLRRFPAEPRLDARGNAVLPGFVDAHTHLVFASDRAAEFESRLQGKTYQEIMAAGGGINSTVRATRAASREELLAQSGKRAAGMLAHGTTTAEAKSGYGLELEAELETTGGCCSRWMKQVRLPSFPPSWLRMPSHRNSPEMRMAIPAALSTKCFPTLRSWWQRARPG